MMLAIALLILTPVTRVLVSIYVFYIDDDRKYVVVTGLVFLSHGDDGNPLPPRIAITSSAPVEASANEERGYRSER